MAELRKVIWSWPLEMKTVSDEVPEPIFQQRGGPKEILAGQWKETRTIAVIEHVEVIELR